MISGDGEKAERSIALLSGKGGSGKTMIAAVAAEILASYSVVTIVDADTGTAGLTYYLGLKHVSNIRTGLTSYIEFHSTAKQVSDLKPQPVEGMDAAFFGVGDHRRLEILREHTDVAEVLGNVLKLLVERSGWCVVDCRGGIDSESLAVCRVVDDIILIAEPDTTSFQATRHVVDVLAQNNLAGKLRGFFVNKAFDDPAPIARAGVADFGTQMLSAVPFDLRATRSFLIGEIPPLDSVFAGQVWHGLSRAYPWIKLPPRRAWSSREFREVGLSNLDSVRGGLALAGLMTVMAINYIVYASRQMSLGQFLESESSLFAVGAMLTGLAACIEPMRRRIGRVIDLYVRAFRKLVD